MRIFKILGATMLVLAFAGPATAAPMQCDTIIEGEPVTIFYNTDDPTYSSLRERFLRRGQACPGRLSSPT